jgi:hypothetical protein
VLPTYFLLLVELPFNFLSPVLPQTVHWSMWFGFQLAQYQQRIGSLLVSSGILCIPHDNYCFIFIKTSQIKLPYSSNNLSTGTDIKEVLSSDVYV